MVAGTIPTSNHAMRMEMWRCVNLLHLCSYVIADKQRSTYNVDHFLVPVGLCYGEWDGESKFGMLTLDELDALCGGKTPLAEIRARHDMNYGVKSKSNIAVAARSGPSPSSLKPTSTKVPDSSNRRSGKVHDKERESIRRDKGNRNRAAETRGSSSNVTHGFESRAASIANSRGDVSSPAAVMHAALGVRLYMLVDLVLQEKLSRAAWPAWNSLLMKIRTKTEKLKQRALFRLPRIYQTSVRFLVAASLLTDTYLLGSHAARLLRNADSNSGWAQHAYFGMAIDLLLNILLTWCIFVFLTAIQDMQTPYGGKKLDMPGLSYVCGAAEASLRMMIGGETRGHLPAPHNHLFKLLNGPLDAESLVQASASRNDRGDREENDEEEEDDAGDE